LFESVTVLFDGVTILFGDVMVFDGMTVLFDGVTVFDRETLLFDVVSVVLSMWGMLSWGNLSTTCGTTLSLSGASMLSGVSGPGTKIGGSGSEIVIVGIGIVEELDGTDEGGDVDVDDEVRGIEGCR
jgi:hypothetical protein